MSSGGEQRRPWPSSADESAVILDSPMPSGGGFQRDRGERRSARKLTKDSGYETSPYSESDYVSLSTRSDSAETLMDELKRLEKRQPPLQQYLTEEYLTGIDTSSSRPAAALETTERQMRPGSISEGSDLGSVNSGSTLVAEKTTSSSPCSAVSSSTRNGAVSLSSGSRRTSAAGSGANLNGNRSHSGSEGSPSDHQYEVKRGGLLATGSAVASGMVHSQRSSTSGSSAAMLDDEEREREEYANHLRSFSYQLHSRQWSGLSLGSTGADKSTTNGVGGVSTGHVRQLSNHSGHSSNDGEMSVSMSSARLDQQSSSIVRQVSSPEQNTALSPEHLSADDADRTSEGREDSLTYDLDDIDSVLAEDVPERDPASLKQIRYGPGHEKYPSWPVQAVVEAGLPSAGSHRSKSWTDNTEYDRDKAGISSRQPAKKSVNSAFQQQLNTVMEKCERIGPESFLSPDERELARGKEQLTSNSKSDIKDYNIPSPPERDVNANSFRSDSAEYPEVSLSSLTTPFLDQLRHDIDIASGEAGSTDAPTRDSSWDHDAQSRSGRDSAATVVTYSSSNSSGNDMMRLYGSISDISVVSSSTSRSEPLQDHHHHQPHHVAHSTRIRQPVRLHSETALSEVRQQQRRRVATAKSVDETVLGDPSSRLGAAAFEDGVDGPGTNSHQSPVIDYSRPPSVTDRIRALEQKARAVRKSQQQQHSKSVPNLISDKLNSSTASWQHEPTSYSPESRSEHGMTDLDASATRHSPSSSDHRRSPSPEAPKSATGTDAGSGTAGQQDSASLKTLQKMAVLSYYERQMGRSLQTAASVAAPAGAVDPRVPEKHERGYRADATLWRVPEALQPDTTRCSAAGMQRTQFHTSRRSSSASDRSSGSGDFLASSQQCAARTTSASRHSASRLSGSPPQDQSAPSSDASSAGVHRQDFQALAPPSFASLDSALEALATYQESSSLAAASGQKPRGVISSEVPRTTDDTRLMSNRPRARGDSSAVERLVAPSDSSSERFYVNAAVAAVGADCPPERPPKKPHLRAKYAFSGGGSVAMPQVAAASHRTVLVPGIEGAPSRPPKPESGPRPRVGSPEDVDLPPPPPPLQPEDADRTISMSDCDEPLPPPPPSTALEGASSSTSPVTSTTGSTNKDASRGQCKYGSEGRYRSTASPPPLFQSGHNHAARSSPLSGHHHLRPSLQTSSVESQSLHSASSSSVQSLTSSLGSLSASTTATTTAVGSTSAGGDLALHRLKPTSSSADSLLDATSRRGASTTVLFTETELQAFRERELRARGSLGGSPSHWRGQCGRGPGVDVGSHSSSSQSSQRGFPESPIAVEVFNPSPRRTRSSPPNQLQLQLSSLDPAAASTAAGSSPPPPLPSRLASPSSGVRSLSHHTSCTSPLRSTQLADAPDSDSAGSSSSSSGASCRPSATGVVSLARSSRSTAGRASAGSLLDGRQQRDAASRAASALSHSSSEPRLITGARSGSCSAVQEGSLECRLSPGSASASKLTSSLSSNPTARSAQTSSPARPPTETSPLRADSAYYTTSESKALFLAQYGRDASSDEATSGLQSADQVRQRKEELVSRISGKLSVLRSERCSIAEEMSGNVQLGSCVLEWLQQLGAAQHQLDKYQTYVQQISTVTSLLLGLAGRLARAQNAIDSPDHHHTDTERMALTDKRDKLRAQLDEAGALKRNIDARGQQVEALLQQFLSDAQMADYQHFISMKAKLIVDAREVDDKLRLGEEQLAALTRASGVAT